MLTSQQAFAIQRAAAMDRVSVNELMAMLPDDIKYRIAKAVFEAKMKMQQLLLEKDMRRVGGPTLTMEIRLDQRAIDGASGWHDGDEVREDLHTIVVDLLDSDRMTVL